VVSQLRRGTIVIAGINNECVSVMTAASFSVICRQQLLKQPRVMTNGGECSQASVNPVVPVGHSTTTQRQCRRRLETLRAPARTVPWRFQSQNSGSRPQGDLTCAERVTGPGAKALQRGSEAYLRLRYGQNLVIMIVITQLI